MRCCLVPCACRFCFLPCTWDVVFGRLRANVVLYRLDADVVLYRLRADVILYRFLTDVRQGGRSKNEGRPVHRPVGVFNPAALRLVRRQVPCQTSWSSSSNTFQKGSQGSGSRRGRNGSAAMLGPKIAQKPRKNYGFSTFSLSKGIHRSSYRS